VWILRNVIEKPEPRIGVGPDIAITARDRSIKAVLAASTLTPAMTAPELSLACPEIVLRAEAVLEKSTASERLAKAMVMRNIKNPLSDNLARLCECYIGFALVSMGR
jgi:hypothetical protein